ncbi:MAG: 30S ribosomal protein S8 [Verrucomicrobia bacterium]|nr:30S ribosomal protein S8 [Verrucomicrobiota bacterium]
MSMSDPIADMLTRIRNAGMAGQEVVEMPHSQLKSEIGRILKKEGYVLDYTTEGHEGKKVLRVFMKYGVDREPAIQGLSRVSKPGLRRYVSSDSIPRVLGGMGVAVLSTSSGIMTDREARKAGVGGEVLCHVW